MRVKTKPLPLDDWMNAGLDESEPEDRESDSRAGVIVTKSRLATITGLSLPTIDKAFEAGAPVVAKGNRKQGWQVNTADFIAFYTRWKVQQATGDEVEHGTFDQAKAAKMQADAETAQMRLAKLRGETITIENAVSLYREEATVIRSQLMAIPGRCATLLANESDPSVIERMISDEVNIALSNITGDREETWTGASYEYAEEDDGRDERIDGIPSVQSGAGGNENGKAENVSTEEPLDRAGMG